VSGGLRERCCCGDGAALYRCGDVAPPCAAEGGPARPLCTLYFSCISAFSHPTPLAPSFFFALSFLLPVLFELQIGTGSTMLAVPILTTHKRTRTAGAAARFFARCAPTPLPLLLLRCLRRAKGARWRRGRGSAGAPAARSLAAAAPRRPAFPSRRCGESAGSVWNEQAPRIWIHSLRVSCRLSLCWLCTN
jgi:hypothetical protein